MRLELISTDDSSEEYAVKKAEKWKGGVGSGVLELFLLSFFRMGKICLYADRNEIE